MKKTRGKKAKASSQKKSNKLLPFFKRFLLIALIVGILAISLNISNFTGNAITGNAVLIHLNDLIPCGTGQYQNYPVDCGGYCAGTQSECPGSASTSSSNDFLSQELPSESFWSGVVDFFNTGAPINALTIGNTWKDLVIAIIVFVIILAGMSDILMLISIFDSKWVIWVMSVGLAIIASLTGLIRSLTTFLIQIAAGFGAFGIVFEIVISIIIFIGLSIGSTWIANWSAKRQANKVIAKATRGTGKLRAGVRAAKALGEEAAKGE